MVEFSNCCLLLVINQCVTWPLSVFLSAHRKIISMTFATITLWESRNNLSSVVSVSYYFNIAFDTVITWAHVIDITMKILYHIPNVVHIFNSKFCIRMKPLLISGKIQIYCSWNAVSDISYTSFKTNILCFSNSVKVTRIKTTFDFHQSKRDNCVVFTSIWLQTWRSIFTF